MYSELRRHNYILIVLENESSFDYMIRFECKKLVNCELRYPDRNLFRLNSMSMNYIKLVQMVQDDINFELEYSYKNLSTSS